VCVLNSIGKLCVVHGSKASFCSMHQYGASMQNAPWKFVRFLFMFSVRSAIESWSSRRCPACEQTQNGWVKQASYNRMEHDSYLSFVLALRSQGPCDRASLLGRICSFDESWLNWLCSCA
jgi:hypothetical protein